jgi:hypothetical protein
VLPAIPEPDGTPDFAARAVDIAIPPDTAVTRKAPLGLAWRDRFIEAADGIDCEAQLLEALESIDPPEQRARVTGWTTSARFVPRGALDILHQSQLIVARGPPPPELADMPAMKLSIDHTAWDRIEPPSSWKAWRRFHGEIERDPAFAPALPRLRWHPAFADRPAEQIAREALRMTTQALAPAVMTRLLSQLILADSELSAAAQSIAAEYARALAGKTEGRRLIDELMAMSEAVPADFAFTLLGMAESDAVASLPEHQLARWIRHARSAAREGRLAGSPRARANLITLFGRALVSPESSEPEFAAMKELIERWPENDRRELLALTIGPYLRMIFDRSRALGATLATSVLRRAYYSEGARSPTDANPSVPVAFAVGQAIERLGAGGGE